MKNLTSLAHVGSDASGIPWDLTPDPNRTDTVASSQPEPGGFDEQDLLSESTQLQYINTQDSWQVSLLVISSVNVVIIFIFWMYILYISYVKTTRWKPPLLPHILMFGLLLASAAGFPHLAPRVQAACQGARITTSLSYTIVYSSLLVRLVCLRSLHIGIFLPTPYQALLLLFCILVQVGLSMQWFIEDRTSCRGASPISHLLSTLYPLILFLFVLALATLTRKAREHYTEAKYIWWALMAHLPLWIGWTSAAVVIENYFNVICGLGLQGFVLLTFLILLLPRYRFLSRLSRDGYNKFENDPYAYHSDGGFGWSSGSKSSWEPSFSSWKHKHEGESSYLGFHRPTRVVPPSSSSMSHSTFSPGLLYPDRFAYLLPPFSRVKPYPATHNPHHNTGINNHHATSSRPIYSIPAASLAPGALGGGGGRSSRQPHHGSGSYMPNAATASLYPGHHAPHYMYKDYNKMAAGGSQNLSASAAAAAANKGFKPRSSRLDRDRSAWQRAYTPSDYIF